MPVLFDRQVFFDMVRASLFGGSLTQGQVNGMSAILNEWERAPYLDSNTNPDFRHLAYPLATTYHETAKTMLPIEEYGKGQGKEYGKKDPQTGQTYYGRGFVQLTWRDNYAKADAKLFLIDDRSCEWHAENALDPFIAADVMFRGMEEGWFRGDSKGRQTLTRYFGVTSNDAYMAREIINGDKTIVPSWSNGISIGNLVKDYHVRFLDALKAAAAAAAVKPPPPDTVYPEIPTRPIEPELPIEEPLPEDLVVELALTIPVGVVVRLTVNGEPYAG